jgi:hypothetical protein
MPIYADASLGDVFGPELLTRLKGESCFYLRRLTPELRAQISAALETGRRLYEERGWV